MSKTMSSNTCTTSSTTTTTHDYETMVALDTSIPEDLQCHYEHLPLPYQVIPSSVQSLSDCAKWQIESMPEEEEDALDDGFILCDVHVIVKKLQAWRHLFPRIKPFFALKCNPDPMVAAVLGQTNQAAGFDCASLSEIRLAVQSTTTNPTTTAQRDDQNLTNNLIVYANPQRAERDLEKSLRLNIHAFTFDGEEELHKIHRTYQKILSENNNNNDKARQPPPPPQMILRLLVPDTHSTVPLGEKFGAPPIPSRVETLTQLAMELQLPIIGVSFHCGSGCHDPEAYQQAIKLAKQAMDIIDKCQTQGKKCKCWLLDIGGGFPGVDGWQGDEGRFSSGNSDSTTSSGNTTSDPTIETAAKIAQAINPLLDELFSPEIQIISEPGRYFVEAAFALCSRIYKVQTVDDDSNDDDGHNNKKHYTIAQGVQGVFKDVVLCGETFHPIPLQLIKQEEINTNNDSSNGNDNDATSTKTYPSTIHGPSGDEDIICQADLPELQVGDWLLWDRMGAYTLSISARSGRPPIRYAMGGGGSDGDSQNERF